MCLAYVFKRIKLQDWIIPWRIHLCSENKLGCNVTHTVGLEYGEFVPLVTSLFSYGQLSE